MDVYFLATRVLVPEECVDCQASAILYQPEPEQLTPPPHKTQPLHKLCYRGMVGAVGGE